MSMGKVDEASEGSDMGFRAVVTSTDLSLTAAEGRVVEVLLGNENGTTVTAAAVGVKAKTHESTVIRLARKLGYRGYPELREDILRDANGGTSTATVMRAERGWSLAALAQDEATTLVRLPSFVSQEQLDAAAATVERANRVYLFGNNDALPVLQVMDRRLRRLGLTVVLMTGRTKDLAEHFVSFDGQSLLLGFVLLQGPPHLPKLVAEAQRRGGSTLLITDVPGLTFRPQPTHLLAAPRSEDREYNTLLVPMILSYALQLAIFHRDPARFQRVRDDIDDLTRMTGGPDEIPLRA